MSAKDDLPAAELLAALREELLADPLIAASRRAGRRPRVGVSACLLGDNVRYDGDHRRVALVADLLREWVDCVPLCPEVAIGLGVPRPSIQRVRLTDGREIVRGVENPAQDFTARLDTYARDVARAQVLHGYVFKARSPSCAPGNTPVFDERDVAIAIGWGAYADRLRQTLPQLVVRDEEDLARPGGLQAFLRELFRLLA